MLFGAHIAPIQPAATELFRVVEISWANWQVDVFPLKTTAPITGTPSNFASATLAK